MPKIEVRGVCKCFARPAGGSVRVLDGLDLVAGPGQVHAILGFSGCGKSTLLRLIAGLDSPDSGSIAFDDKAAHPRVGIVFQEPRLLPWATVAENLRLALRRTGCSSTETDRRIFAMLDLVGLGGCADLTPAELSGGMAQRAALARALLREPDVLLLDEPLGALDPLTRRQMQDELARLRSYFGRTTLLVTHEVAEAVRLADRISLIAHGRVAHSFVVREGACDPAPTGTAARELEELVLQTLLSDAPTRRPSVKTDSASVSDVLPLIPRPKLLASAAAAMVVGRWHPARAASALHVSYVLRPFNVPQTVMRQQRLLEKRLEPLGVEVVWHDIVSGVIQAQALAANSLDIGTVMNPISVILALANGNPMKIVDGFARVNRLAAILALDPAIRTVSDLKGRTIAGLKGSVPHQLLLKSLQSASLSSTDVTFLDMELTTSYTALLSKQVDAVILAADLILKAKRAGAHEIPTPPNLVQPINTACARNAFIAQQPDLVRLYKDAAKEAADFVAANPEEAIRIGCDVNGLNQADGRELFGWQTFITGLTNTDVASMQRDMAFLLENKLCPRPVDLHAAMWEAMAP